MRSRRSQIPFRSMEKEWTTELWSVLAGWFVLVWLLVPFAVGGSQFNFVVIGLEASLDGQISAGSCGCPAAPHTTASFRSSLHSLAFSNLRDGWGSIQALPSEARVLPEGQITLASPGIAAADDFPKF